MAEQPKKQSFAPQVSSSTFCLFSEHVHHQNKIQARWADINTPALIPRGVKSHLLFALFFFSSFFFSPTDFNSLFLRYPLPLSHLQMPPLISIQINFIFLGRQYPTACLILVLSWKAHFIFSNAHFSLSGVQLTQKCTLPFVSCWSHFPEKHLLQV